MNEFEQDPVFGDILNLDDEPLFQDNWSTLQDTPPYDQDGLYSTPLSWDPPQTRAVPPTQPKLEQVHAVQPVQLNVQQTPLAPTLSAAQQELLRSIAMPEHLQYSSTQGHSPQSATSTTYKSGSVSSPEQNDLPRKRKSSSEEIEDDHSGDENVQRPVKKTAHNMIEKRYRTNLNDKIAALRDSVPSLRVMAKGARGDGEKEDLQGLTPAHKLNKATVLAKATEYIRHLEKRTKRLQDENASMKSRIAAFEKLFLSGSMGMNPAPPPSHQFTFNQEQFMGGASTQMNGQITPNVSPRGMIDMADDFRRVHQTQQINQQTYQVPQGSYPAMNRQDQRTNSWSSNGQYFGKMMVGSLAGLMILEGFSESHSTGNEAGSRGLFAIPTHLLCGIAKYIKTSGELNVFGTHISSAQTFSYLRLILMIGALVYVFIPSFFATPSESKDAKTPISSAGIAPSLASPIQERRQAWLTAIQTVWVPRHNFFLEATALVLKMLKLSVRNLIGSYGYAILTGTTEVQEAARVKAWSIALDAQLVGGDVEVSRSRLTLTLLASGTLPDTPLRLMLKALHFRVLFWGVGNNAGFLNELAIKLARWKWNEARQLQKLYGHAHSSHNQSSMEPLPDHLVSLLSLDADEVLTDSITQRAYNLAYNLPTTHNSLEAHDGMDGIVDDHTIRSPLDAVAAWFSSTTLQRVLESALDSDSDSPAVLQARSAEILSAINTAPIGSSSRLRALVARAVFVKEDRGRSIAAAKLELDAVSPPEEEDHKTAAKSSAPPALIMKASNGPALAELGLAITCAKAIAHLSRGCAAGHATAFPIIRSITPASTKLSLLGFASCYKLLETILQHDGAEKHCQDSLEALAGSLRIWIGGVEGEQSGVAREIKAVVVERCIAVAKDCVGMAGDDIDTGYESMSDLGEGC